MSAEVGGGGTHKWRGIWTRCGSRIHLNYHSERSGWAFAGYVKSTKMNRTIIVRRDYLHFVKKYGR